MPNNYVPERGDVIWVSFTPQSGHEQAGRCPALILSPSAYNGKVGLALMCPLTNQIKGYPFEVNIPADSAITGTVLSDQMKSLDWRSRNAEFVCQLPAEVVEEVLAKINALLR